VGTARVSLISCVVLCRAVDVVAGTQAVAEPLLWCLTSFVVANKSSARATASCPGRRPAACPYYLIPECSDSRAAW
jgi:hypothetical protein